MSKATILLHPPQIIYLLDENLKPEPPVTSTLLFFSKPPPFISKNLAQHPLSALFAPGRVQGTLEVRKLLRKSAHFGEIG